MARRPKTAQDELVLAEIGRNFVIRTTRADAEARGAKILGPARKYGDTTPTAEPAGEPVQTKARAPRDTDTK